MIEAKTLYKKYNGWNAMTLQNQWIALFVIPQLGGRIMQIDFNGHPFLFVNPKLAGKIPNEDGLGDRGAWLNFGGEKIWPAPQGWGSTDLWPGPPDPVLDSGPYTIEENGLSEKDKCNMISLADPYTGLQIQKEISLSEEATTIKVDVTFTNTSEEKREWSVWPVIQLDTANYNAGKRYSVVCPVNRNSYYDKGYTVMHGLVNNPQNKKDDNGHFRLDYQYLVGKVGLDSDAGWVAFCDKQEGKIFVTNFEYQEGLIYPENTSVQLWMQGRGMIYSRNKIREFPDDVAETPPYLEIELLSQLHQILPGESVHFSYSMQTCTVPKGLAIQSKNSFGVIALPLRMEIREGFIYVTGCFGVFREAVMYLRFKDNKGNSIEHKNASTGKPVNPLVGISINTSFRLSDLEAFSEIRACLDIYDISNNFLEEFDTTSLCKF